MIIVKAFVSLLVLISAMTPIAWGDSLTPNTRRLTAGESSPSAAIAGMSWLAGTWRGNGPLGDSEEIWSEPSDGAMLGSYRLSKKGKPAFYELLVIQEEGDSLVLRLKHFHPDLRGWEERDAALRMPLVSIRPGRAEFDGLTFQLESRHQLTIYVAIEDGTTGSVREAAFRLNRVDGATDRD